jgi:hypothetical protein
MNFAGLNCPRCFRVSRTLSKSRARPKVNATRPIGYQIEGIWAVELTPQFVVDTANK